MSQSFDGNETKDVPREDVPPTVASTTCAGNERRSTTPIVDAGNKRGSLKPLVDKDESDVSKAKEPDGRISSVHLRRRIGVIVIAVFLVVAAVAIVVSIVILSKPDPPTPRVAPIRTRESPTTSMTIEQQLTVACNFLNYSNIPECQSITVFQSATIGNTIPTELGLLTQLTHLWLFPLLNGTIPSELGNLINLKELILANNELSSTIPPELGNLTDINTINLGTNQLNGTIPSTFGNLIYVTNMYLDNNQLTGLIPSSALENLLNLTVLDLYANPLLFGTIPASLCNRSNIDIGIDCGTGRIACSCCGYSNRTECPSTGGGYYGGF